MYTWMDLIGSNTPVCAEYPIESFLFTKLTSNNVEVVVVCHHFIALPIGNCIIRHNCGSLSCSILEFKCTFLIWNFVKVIVFTRINSKLSTTIMSITSSFTWASAWPMFSHGIHTLKSPCSIEGICTCGCLETIAIGLCYICDQLRILRICSLESVPARFCAQVNLWRKTSSKS